MNVKKLALSVAVFGTLHLVFGEEAKTQEESAIVEAVQAMFDAMEDRDAAAFENITLPQLRFVAVLSGDSTVTRATSREVLIDQIGSTTRNDWRERMFDPEVRISGPVATVWTNYDFYSGGEFSHCGVDSFQLFKIGGGWKIAEVAYTVVRERDVCSTRLGRQVQ